MTLGHAIKLPTLSYGEIAVAPVHKRDAAAIRSLLWTERSWLHRWEVTDPLGFAPEPGSVDQRPTIKWQQKQARLGNSVTCTVRYANQIVGQVVLGDLIGGGVLSGQLGYWISQEYAGLGITPVATALLADWGFAELGLHRLELGMLPENAPSKRVAEKLGFRFEGIRERYIFVAGSWRDHHIYAQTVEELAGSTLLRRVVNA